MTITYDIRTKVIDKNQNVWIVFPGRARKHLKNFQDTRRLFLDLPGTKFTNDVNNWKMSDYVSKNEVKDIVRKNINMSLAIKDWYSDETPAENPVFPSRDIERYSARPNKIHKQFGVLVGCAGKFFIGMKKGDLVLVPGKGGAYSQVLLGEIKEDFDSEDYISLSKYGQKNFNAEPSNGCRALLRE